jgi:hypothetical protein
MLPQGAFDSKQEESFGTRLLLRSAPSNSPLPGYVAAQSPHGQRNILRNHWQETQLPPADGIASHTKFHREFFLSKTEEEPSLRSSRPVNLTQGYLGEHAGVKLERALKLGDIGRTPSGEPAHTSPDPQQGTGARGPGYLEPPVVEGEGGAGGRQTVHVPPALAQLWQYLQFLQARQTPWPEGVHVAARALGSTPANATAKTSATSAFFGIFPAF